VKQLPATPIVGPALIRPALHSLETLNQELQSTHSHKRSIIVPIAIPSEYLRYLASAGRRSLGPHDEEASGIDFVMRTIGRKFEKKEEGEQETVEDTVDAAEDEAESDEGEEAEGPTESAEATKNFERMVDPSLLSPAQLEAIFGDRAADLSGVFFQHSTRIAERAEFFPRTACFTWRPTDRSHPRRYCKGQVHPSAYISALRLVLIQHAPVSKRGAGRLDGRHPRGHRRRGVGYKKVFYVGDDNEHTMMQFPTPDETVDWTQCPTPPVRSVQPLFCHQRATGSSASLPGTPRRT
jgi:hypothetical protein